MIFRYITLKKKDDGFGYPVGESFLSEAVYNENMIFVMDDFTVDNKRWNYTTSEWEEYVAEPAPEPETPQPTQLDKIQPAQLTIMAAMADQYEESLEKDLRNMDVQATIYEAILELGGAE